MTRRTNEAWLSDLCGPQRQAALEDLRAYLVQGLRYALKQKYGVTDADIEDFVQDALVKIMDALDTFRGESRFTTWAQKIAVRVALSELRRKRWENVSLQDLLSKFEGDYTPSYLKEPDPSPEQQVTQQMLMSLVQQIIHEELTNLQRQALTAVMIGGMSPGELARRLGTSRNTIYKRLHDARLRLKKTLLAHNLAPEDVLAAFEG
jgi:RNA polymerase sigma-70 factor, ECF subfamily